MCFFNINLQSISGRPKRLCSLKPQKLRGRIWSVTGRWTDRLASARLQRPLDPRGHFFAQKALEGNSAVANFMKVNFAEKNLLKCAPENRDGDEYQNHQTC